MDERVRYVSNPNTDNDKNLKKIEIKIHGREYTLRGYESVEHMKKVANYVDLKMAEVSRGSLALGSTVLSTLTCINIADEYIKLHDSIDKIKSELQKKTEELEKYRTDIDKTKENCIQSQIEIAKLKDELK